MKIRNFAIIAHIDHGKSTLADRFLQQCQAVSTRELQNQMLDTLEVEKQRGITVKSQTARLDYTHNNEKYVLNLIDTPGHVDFSFEVRRALAACEGAIVLIDATQGIEAQTIANVYRAMEANVKLLPVLNKVDLPSAQTEAVAQQIKDILGITEEPLLISAKTGLGVDKLLNKLVEFIPSPYGKIENPLQALLIDSWFDPYLGVVLLICVKEGKIKNGQIFKFLSNETTYKVEKLHFLKPKLVPTSEINAGEVGIIIANIRNIKDCQVGDTIAEQNFKGEALNGFPGQKAVVFCGLFPPDTSIYQDMKDAIERLALNDASLSIEPMHSPALGVGFRCGFLGLLHLEVITQRLEQEFNIEPIVTAPNVEYEIIQTNGKKLKIHDASLMPSIQKIQTVLEPWVKITVFSPEEYIGEIMKLCLSRRAQDQEIKYINQIGNIQNITCSYKIPLSEIIFDFHDKLKSLSQGYASFDYEEGEYQESNVVVVNILVNSTLVEGLSTIVHKDNAQTHARWVCKKLKEEIPRQLFVIAIQAAISGKIIARETVSALRKDVTAKCYGGDVSRKRKLLDKQKEGKKRRKEFSVGNVTIPNKAILKVLRKSE